MITSDDGSVLSDFFSLSVCREKVNINSNDEVCVCSGGLSGYSLSLSGFYKQPELFGFLNFAPENPIRSVLSDQ
jgi:hypothetical protein